VGNRARRSVPIVAGALLVAAALLVYRPGPLHGLRNWGVHFATYLPAWAQIAFWLPAALLAFSSHARALILAAVAAWGRILAGTADPRARRRIGDLLVPVGITILFWLLRSRYVFLGDNGLRLEQATQGRVLPFEWGTMFLAHRAVVLGRDWFQWEPRLSLAVFDTLAGLPFAIAAVSIARSMGRTALQRGAIHLGFLSLGAVQLFCGYVEAYSWAMALVTAYLAGLLRALRGGSWARPALLLALAVAMHAVSVLFALPLLLSLRRGRAGSPGWVLADVSATAVRGIAALLIAVAAAAPLVLPRLFHGYGSSRAGDLTLLSPVLWWERVNGMLLAGVAGTLIGLPLLATIFTTPRALGAQKLHLGAVALPALAALLPMKMVLGAADWDIIAFAGLPLLVWTASWIVSERDPAAEDLAGLARSGRWAFVPLLLFMSLANTGGFIAVNHGETSVRRIREIVSDDPAPYYRDHPPPVHLSMLFGMNGLMEPCRGVLLEGMKTYPNDPRLPHNLASVYFQEERWEEAKQWARRTLDLCPGYVPSLRLLYSVTLRQGDRGAQIARGGEILEAHARDPVAIERYFSAAELQAMREAVAAGR
jgi:hypothetical protein